MDLGVGEMRFTFCGKHHLVTRTRVRGPGFMGPLLLFNIQSIKVIFWLINTSMSEITTKRCSVLSELLN